LKNQNDPGKVDTTAINLIRARTDKTQMIPAPICVNRYDKNLNIRIRKIIRTISNPEAINLP